VYQALLLEHKYTEANLDFDFLKGSDQEMVEMLRKSTDKDGKPLFIVGLLLLEKYENGHADED